MSHDRTDGRTTPPQQPPIDEVLPLISRLCDGLLTRSECQRLERLLASSDGGEAINLYLAAMELHTSLSWRWHGSRQTVTIPAGATPERRPAVTASLLEWLDAIGDRVASAVGNSLLAVGRRLSRRRGWLVVGLIAGSLLIVAGWASGIANGPLQQVVSFFGTSPRPQRLPGSIACVTAAHDAVWAALNEVHKDGAGHWHPNLFDSLFAGHRFELVSGLAEISYDSGATIILQGPARLTITQPTQLELERGRATVTLDSRRGSQPGEHVRFAVVTPTATVHDLGTSFGVAVADSGTTDVVVFAGVVDLLPRGSASGQVVWSQRLTAGSRARVDTARQVSEPPVGVARQFVRTTPRSADGVVPPPFPWSAAAAVTMFDDPFHGEGHLSGSSPVSHGGRGAASWIAPLSGWRCEPAVGGLVTGDGAAFLPVTIEPGHLYRITVDLQVTAGGQGWVAVGLTNSPDPRISEFTSVSVLQRHNPAAAANECRLGRRRDSRVLATDRLSGRRRRTLILDTTAPVWRVWATADGEGWTGPFRLVDPLHRQITHVGLAAFPHTQAIVHRLRVESLTLPVEVSRSRVPGSSARSFSLASTWLPFSPFGSHVSPKSIRSIL